MNLRRKLLAFLKSQKKNAEYTELEYLESTGTQWIDTGFLSNQLYDKSLYIKMKTTGGTSSYAFNGAYHISGTGLTVQFGLLATSDTLCRTTLNHFDPSYLNVTNLQKSEYTEMMMTPTEYWVNGELKSTHEQTSVDKILETNNPFLLFGRSQYNQPNSITPMIISEFWIKDSNGKFIQHLIPVLDKDFVPCMYDKVTGKFLYNQGDGEFKWKLHNQLEYLECDGNQWIDTGFAPSSNTRVVGSVLFNKWLGGANYVFGVYGDNANFGFNVGSARGYFNVPWYNNAGLRVSITPTLNTIFNFDISKDGMITNGTLFTYPLLESAFQSERTMFIGWCNGTTQNKLSGRIYPHKIYENDVLVHLLIPAFDKNLNICMYDLVSKKYFYNQGSGTFKGFFEDGSQLVVYLSATGTQWIDTGIIPLMGDELELKNVQCKKKSSGIQAVFSAGTGSHQLIILVADGMYSDRASFYKYFASGGAKNINPPNYLNDPTKIKIDSEGNVFYNDVFIIQSPPENETNSSLRLFYRANNSSPMTGNIGAVNIKRDGEFVINLIPVVKSDNTVCMLDLVRDKYLENSGSGSFTYGTVVNLFNPSNPSYVAGYITTVNNGSIASSTLTDTFYIPCKPNTTYLITRSSVNVSGQVWRAATVSQTPYTGMLCPNFVGGLTDDLALTITSGANDKYLIFSEGQTMATNDLTKFTVVEITNYGG